MKRVALLLTLISATALACEEKVITYSNDKTIKVCKRGDELYSLGCEDISKCFTLPKEKLPLNSYQNPLFTLCYRMQGVPYFVKGELPICIKDGKVRDLESLMKAFNRP